MTFSPSDWKLRRQARKHTKLLAMIEVMDRVLPPPPMKTVQITRYQCETCGESYGTAGAAESCESRPVLQDKGVNVGDVVLVTGGEGAGLWAKVESRCVLSREWGHYQWERYWHTVALTAKLLNGIGHRQLTFDHYEVISPNQP